MKSALIINPEDNVAVLTEGALKGEEIVCRGSGSELSLFAACDIPVYHKVAVRNIPKGSRILKYGEIIGIATADIAAGEHVHTHNVESARNTGQAGSEVL
ncbi:MAG: UxaA family hydrolase [Firmicutes bacterium]|nr:UxaA family hydrolase [Bacillota bacterium]